MLILLVVCVFICLLLGVPVAFALGGVSVIFTLFTDVASTAGYASRVWTVMNTDTVVAVPLFIFMGVMLERSGIAEDLLEAMARLFGRLRGGLAVSVVLVGALLAASTGIVGATVVTMGLMSLPIMLRHGYSKELATGTIAASGTLGQIIPPSIVLILLGDALGVDVGSMFRAAMLPGLLLVALYVLWIIGIAFLRPRLAPAIPIVALPRTPSAAEVGEAAATRFLKQARRRVRSGILKSFIPPFLLMLIVLGSIFAGIATPTEAAGVGALGATLLTLAMRRFTWASLRRVMRETTMLTSMVFIILLGAGAFSLVFGSLGGKEAVQGIILRLGLSPRETVLIIMLVVFLLGFFVDFFEIIFIVVPVILPLLDPAAYGGQPHLAHEQVNLLWFGILMAMNLQTSFLTPPFGFALFFLRGVAPPEVRSGHIYRGILPFICIQIAALLLIYFWPAAVTWADKPLPEVLRQLFGG